MKNRKPPPELTSSRGLRPRVGGALKGDDTIVRKILTVVSKINWLLVGILVLGLMLRFLWFKQSTYFGFDEARDAFIGQGIYKNLD